MPWLISLLSALRQGAKYHLEEAKRIDVPVIWPEKITFAVMRIEPRTFHFRVSDSPIQPNCSHILNINYSSWYIYTKTWKGKLQAVTMALRPMATSSVRVNSHLKWFHARDTESYVIGCDFLKFCNLWSLCDCPMRKIHCVKADFTKYCGTAYKAYALL
jgi:hypothetical protein